MAKHTIAMVFDFDDTLVPDSTTAFLKKKGVDANALWTDRWKPLIESGWDPALAYLKLLLDLSAPGEKLEGLTNEELESFGATLKPYPGLPAFFDQFRESIIEPAKRWKVDVDVKYWVISGGLEPIIKGCKPISANLEAYWGCRLAGNADTPKTPVKYVKRAINFTEKTRYLFEISKGLKNTDGDPFSVNQYMPQRKVPFANMIYIGDGSTDIPCFSLLESNADKGHPVAVISRDNTGNAKHAILESLAKRKIDFHSPDYRKESDLWVKFTVQANLIMAGLRKRDLLDG